MRRPKRLGREVYIMQATVDTRPEDLLVTPVIEGEARLRYVASPLVTAMLRGGIVILDEGNRMSEKSWASLAPLLDNRRYVESIVAGIKIKAHPLFRLVATMNDDASPPSICPNTFTRACSRKSRSIFRSGMKNSRFCKENLPFGDEHILNYVTDFLQQAHAADERYTVRDGINIARFAMKLVHGEWIARGKAADDSSCCGPRSCRRSAKRPCGMSLETELRFPGPQGEDPASLSRGNFRYFPVVPGRVEFATELRRRMLQERPAIVAVELPGSLEDTYRKPLARLPEMSVILYRRSRRTTSAASTSRSSRAIRSPKRCARARNRRGDDLSRARFGATVRICPTPIPTPTRSAASALKNTSRRIACGRRRATKKSPRTPPPWPGSCKAPTARAAWSRWSR